MFDPPIELMGVPGSPYTRKLISLLRYRRIPYRLIQASYYQGNLNQHPILGSKPRPRVPLLPTVFTRDDSGPEQAVCDTTPIIRQLEARYDERSVLPTESRLAFLNDLIEDYADEWLTKPMFHYRWSYEADIYKAGEILPRWGDTRGSEHELAERAEEARTRQIERLSYVGSNEQTRQTIEESFQRFVDKLDKHLISNRFILGDRPASCDFAVFGQLVALALFDPTPQAYILEYTPRLYAWAETVDDLSGLEPDFESANFFNYREIPNTLKALLEEIGRLYAPYLVANATAVSGKAPRLDTELDGRPWTQAPFPYHSKCLQSLRQVFSECSGDEQHALSTLLSTAGFPQHFLDP